MQKQGFPYVKLGVGVVASKEWGESRAAQMMLTLMDPGSGASHLGVCGPNHKKWGKIPHREGWKENYTCYFLQREKETDAGLLKQQCHLLRTPL